MAKTRPGNRVSRKGRAIRFGPGIVAWLLFWVVDVLLLGTVATGFLARYLHPETFWWAQVIAIGLPYLSITLALITLISLLSKRWFLLGIHVFLLLLLLTRAGFPGRLFPGTSVGEPSLSVVSFNLPNLLGSEERSDSTAAFFTSVSGDIVGLQDAGLRSNTPERREGWRSVQVETLVDSLSYTLALPEELPSRQGLRRGGVSQVPILIRERPNTLEVVSSEVFQIADPADAEEASEVSRARVRWQGRDVAFYNIHLRSFSAERPWWMPRRSLLRLSTWEDMLRLYREDFRNRARDVEEIRELLAAEELPIVISGDLNSTPDNWSYAALRQGRNDAMAKRGGWMWGRTYHAEKPFVRIDVVFVDKAFVIDRVETRNVGFSDHRPVVAWIRWREPDGSEEVGRP